MRQRIVASRLDGALALIDRSLFSFDGRLSRRAFWRTYLLISASLALIWVSGLFAVLAIGPVGALIFVLFAPLLVAFASIIIRRGHDRSHGPLWCVFVVLGPLFLSGLADGLISSGTTALVWIGLATSLGAIVFSLWGTVELGFRRGHIAANRYGPPTELPVAA